MATPTFGWDSFFSTTLSSAISNTDTTIPLTAAPTAQEGILVIEPDSAVNREIIYYTSVSGNNVVLPSVSLGRGQEGTSAVAHSSGVIVKRNTTSRDFEVLQDASAWATAVRAGWIPASGTWTYASATTFTVPSADASAMRIGTKIKLTQTTDKYFYVYSVSGTTITIATTTDYTLVNAAITSPVFSNADSPIGFPAEFSYTPSLVNLSGGTLTFAKYMISGKQLHIRFKYALAGAGVGTGVTVSTPVSVNADYSALTAIASGVQFFDTSTGDRRAGQVMPSNATTLSVFMYNVVDTDEITFANLTASEPFIWAAGDEITFGVVLALP